MNQLKQFGEDIWTYDGSEVKFYGFPFTTRMTVIKLQHDDLWIHSPERMNNDLRKELSLLGKVKYLISPNKLHHLFLKEWIDAYPNAVTYSSPGLQEKRKDIEFSFELTDISPDEWKNDINQTIFRGSPAMEEVVFFHKKSKTLLLTDLIENVDPIHLNWWQKRLARYAGIVSPNGKTPIDWRISFIFGDKQKARNSLSIIKGWNVENIILSHGECIYGNGREFFSKSFAWLQQDI